MPKIPANLGSQDNLANLSTVPINNEGRAETISSSVKTTGRKLSSLSGLPKKQFMFAHLILILSGYLDLR